MSSFSFPRIFLLGLFPMLAGSVLAAPPSVAIISPINTIDNGWQLTQGVVTFGASAKAASGRTIDRVTFYVDNVAKNTDSTYPYGYLWDCRTLSAGNHSLKIIAWDNTGEYSSTSTTVKILAASAGTPPTGSVVTSGLLPDIKPISMSNYRLRDVSVCKGADGAFYLTGTGAGQNAWYWNEGINLWRSTDLKTWTYIGLVWSFERDGTATEKTWRTASDGSRMRSFWAPEIYYTKGNYYILWSYAGRGTTILRSSSGKPEGPYVNNLGADKFLFGNIDGSLFTDTDGTNWLAYEYGAIWQLNADLTGKVGSVHYVGDGDEGAFLFKLNGKYYLSAAKFTSSGRYSSWIGIGTSPTGPFSQWHEAIPCGGHNTYFTDSKGQLWGTFWGNDSQAPFKAQAALVKMTVNSDGTLKPNSNQTP